MKSLITVLIITLVGIIAYPTVSATYDKAMQEKAQIDAIAKQYCDDNKHNTKAWVKLKGSLKVYQCNALNKGV
jgi:hypothetical protein